MRRPLRSIAVVASIAIAIATAAVASPASAQTAPNHDEAVRRFQLGKALKEAGPENCPAAIVEFEASVKLEDSIGGRYNLGVCYEKQNAFKKALANYKRAEELAKEKGDDRLREIRAQLAEFFDKTPYIRLALPQPLPKDLRVTVDGDAIPTEELQGETIYFLPTASQKNGSFEVRATATGYQDVRLTVDASTVAKKMLVTIVMRKPDGSTARPMIRQERETKWGPFQYGGLAMIALGAVGVTYSSVVFISYLSEETSLRKKFEEADNAARPCPSDSKPETTCGKNITTREDLRFEYNQNERDAEGRRPGLLAIGIAGSLMVIGGVLLIAYGPRAEVTPGDPGSAVKTRTKPTFQIVPTWTAREQGLSVVGTF